MPYPQQEDKTSGWEYKLVQGLTKGLNLGVSSEQLDDQEALEVKNVILHKGHLKVDTGYKKFASDTVGIPQGVFPFEKSTGVSELLCITTMTLMVYNQSKEQWRFCSDGKKTTTTATVAAGVSVIPVQDSTGFVAGRLIGINLTDGTEHQTTIESVAVGSITIVAAIPVGKSVANGASVQQAVELDGNLDEPVSSEILPSHDWFVFSNGVDNVKRYNSVDCVDLPGLTNVSCKWLRLYNASLFLVNTIEQGQAFPRRVRRSDQANPIEWRVGVGTAGFDDLLDAEDPLQSAEPLGPYLVVYAEREIYRGEFVGTGGINYKFDQMIRGEGVLGSAAVADVGDYHLIMAQSNIYEYRGGFELVPVGDQVYYRIYGSQGIMSPSNKHKAFCFYVEELDEVWLFWPSTKARVGCDRLTRYNVGEKTFTERQFLHEFIGFGYFETRSSRPWNSLVGSWKQQTWKWNERTLLSASPTTHLCVADLPQVMEYDYVSTLDNGTPIPYIVESKDFLTPDLIHRFDMLEFGLRGDQVRVSCSLDEGATWIPLGTVSAATMKRHRLFRQLTFDKIRFRWAGDGGNFQLSWFAFSHREESIYGIV